MLLKTLPSLTNQNKYTKNQKNSQIFKLNQFKHSNIDTLFIKVQLNFIPKHQFQVDNHKLLVTVQ